MRAGRGLRLSAGGALPCLLVLAACGGSGNAPVSDLPTDADGDDVEDGALEGTHDVWEDGDAPTDGSGEPAGTSPVGVAGCAPRWVVGPGEGIPLDEPPGPGLCAPAPPSISEPTCAEGWALAVSPPADGAPPRCEPPPLPTTCAGDGMPVVGSAACAPWATQCLAPTDTARIRELAPEFSGAILVADPSAVDGGDGSVAAPYRALDAAVAAAGDHDIVFAAAGTHAGPVRLERPVALVGSCPSATRVHSDVASASSGVVNAAADNVIANLSVSGEAVGIWIDGGAVEVHDVEVREARRVGIRVAEEGTRAELSSVWVHDIGGTATDDSFGRGVQVSGGAMATLAEVTVQRVRDVGILAIDGGVLSARRVAVSGVTEEMDRGTAGTGIEGFGAAMLDIEEALVERTQAIGVSITEAVGLLEHVLVRKVSGVAGQPASGGIRAGSSSELLADRTWISDVSGPCVAVDGRLGAIQLEHSTLDWCDEGVVAGENTAVYAVDVHARSRREGVSGRNGAEIELNDVRLGLLDADGEVSARPGILVELAAELRGARVELETGAPVAIRLDSARADLDDVRLDGAVSATGSVVLGSRWVIDGPAGQAALQVEDGLALLVDVRAGAPDAPALSAGAPATVGVTRGSLWTQAGPVVLGEDDTSVTVRDSVLATSADEPIDSPPATTVLERVAFVPAPD